MADSPDRDKQELIKQVLKQNASATADLAKTYVIEKHRTGQLTERLSSRLVLATWLGGGLLIGFILFMTAWSFGTKIVELEEGLQEYRNQANMGAVLTKSATTSSQ